MKLRTSLIAIVLSLTVATAQAQRGRVSVPALPVPDPDLPTLPLGGFAVRELLTAAGIEEPGTMTAIEWRLRAMVRTDNEHRLSDGGWLQAQNMGSGLATIYVWRERNGKYCKAQTLTLSMTPGSSVIVPMNSTLYANDDTIWFEYWPSYILSIEAATSFGVWSAFGSVTQGSSSDAPHPWTQPVPASDVSCE